MQCSGGQGRELGWTWENEALAKGSLAQLEDMKVIENSDDEQLLDELLQFMEPWCKQEAVIVLGKIHVVMVVIH